MSLALRHVANGEILGVSLLMEDVLMSGRTDDKQLMISNSDVSDEDDGDDDEALSVQPSSTRASSRLSSCASERTQKSTSRTKTGTTGHLTLYVAILWIVVICCTCTRLL